MQFVFFQQTAAGRRKIAETEQEQIIIVWIFVVQGKIAEADTLTPSFAATPYGLISDPPPSSPHFYAGCPSCCNPPTLSWLRDRRQIC